MIMRNYQILVLTLFSHFTNAIIPLLISTNDLQLTVPQIIKKHGYSVEIFENIATKDKYLLTLFRIPHGKNSTSNSKKPPVLLMHGLCRTSLDYVISGPEKGLAFLLADRGYDVWLGNARGTIYSQKHMVFNAYQPKYWDFSFHEIGVYDLPAYINKIKNVTEQKKISYVGMSQGTTVFYVMASQRTKYNADISVMVSLAPVAYMKHVTSAVFKFLASIENFLNAFPTLTGFGEFPPRPVANLLRLIIMLLCNADNKYFDICAHVVFLVAGNSPDQLDKIGFQRNFADGLAPIAMRQLLHFTQNTNAGSFNRYNFGTGTNLKVYGTENPPPYNISQITAPVALLYSNGDLIAQPEDVERLYGELPNCILKYRVPDERFNHADFLIALDVVPLIQEKVLEVLDQYRSK